MKYLTMTGFTVRTGSDRWTLGYEGENNSRTLQIKTTDDLADFATVNLLIDTLDCGAMTVETVSNYKVLSMVLTAGMLGEAGKKTCQLLMMDAEGTVIKKTNQFQMVVNTSNTVDGMAPDSPSVIIITDYIEEKVNERISDEFLEGKINDWLDDHPEATTTVQDGSLTVAKFNSSVFDDTLSKHGYSADAKATGDAIKKVEENFLWPTIQNIEMLSRIMYFDNSVFSEWLNGYVEDITYDTSRDRYYIGTSSGYIYTVAPSTKNVTNTAFILTGEFSCIDYCEKLDKIIARISGENYIVNPSNMSVEGTLNINTFMVYDSITELFIGLDPTNSGSALISTYEYEQGEFILIESYSIDYNCNSELTQGVSAYNGRIFTANLSVIVEFDYIKRKSIIVYALKENGLGKLEAEGFCVIDGNLVCMCHVYGLGGAYIYKYGEMSAYNLLTDQEAQANNLEYLKITGGINIANDEDLDNYKNVGNYYCHFNDTVATLSNCPTSYAFRLTVYHSTGYGTSKTQELEIFVYPYTKYKRRYDGTVWTEWVIVSTAYGLNPLRFDVQLPGNSNTLSDKITVHGVYVVTAYRNSSVNVSNNCNTVYIVFFSGNSFDNAVKISGGESPNVGVLFDSDGFYLTNGDVNGHRISIIRIG